MSVRLVLALLVLAHMVFAFAYAKATPYRTGGWLEYMGRPKPENRQKDIGAPDERQHANYVQRLLDGKGIPVFNPKDPDLYETYQAHQPPLFYVLAAGWAKVAGVTNVADPETGGRVRGINALLGALTVLGLFWLGTWGFKDEWVGLFAAAIGGFMPAMLALSGALSNDPLLICLCTWTLAFCALGLRDGWCWGVTLRVTIAIALALYTKTSALALFPAVAVALYLARGKPRDGGTILPHAAACLAGPILLALPWLLRNQSLYGDPFAISAFNEAFQGSMKASTGIERLGGVFSYWRTVAETTAYSGFGVFGYMDLFMDWRIYRLLFAAVFLLSVGWLIAFRDRPVEKAAPVQWVHVTFFLVVFLLFVRFNMQYFQAQARYLYPAVGPIACGLAVGAHRFAMRRPLAGLAAVAFTLIALNLYVVSMLPGEFQRRIAPPELNEPTPTAPLEG
ncbi:MAG: phospholipid carrier-dependent glycosyltransferase [Fimbriimonadaceae bacterium]|nr:phospholipid carrier-dependent glycosyltransferase [Fimbriimonadaceae bacterium]